VNPLDLHSGDQIHTVGGTPQVNPPDRDLVYVPRGNLGARPTACERARAARRVVS
jgi:hypothetical protein